MIHHHYCLCIGRNDAACSANLSNVTSFFESYGIALILDSSQGRRMLSVVSMGEAIAEVNLKWRLLVKAQMMPVPPRSAPGVEHSIINCHRAI
jgi:hypothetical protein